MKIIHLSDLHLGKIVLEQSMIEDQKYILNEIINIITKEAVQVVLISGDIYDRSIPIIDAVNLLNEFLTKLTNMNLKVYIITGNHDSKDRLNFASKILECKNLYIEGTYTGNLKCFTLKDEYGNLNIYMLPFVKPTDVKPYFEEDIDSYEEAVRLIIEKEKIDNNERNIILAHQFVTSGLESPERSDSENLSLGGIDNVDVSVFDNFDYVALGHIHGPQKIKRDTVRYAGSPLKYSFSECNHKKSVPIIEFKNDVSYKLEPLKPIRDMREIKGPIHKLLSEEVYKHTNTEDYIKAILTDEENIYDAISKIRKIYPNVLRLEIENNKTAINLNSKTAATGNIKEKTGLELFSEFYLNQNNTTLNDKQIEIMNTIIKEVQNETN
ncbi:MAG: exonuclease SbcCD subunit D [Clostridia bacterium]|nr:exonuclease SbcCD subunit D [Clostridia bacterium]MDD4387341.1 exonuclease SbcCD subunit D [Clostridia bacterium]